MSKLFDQVPFIDLLPPSISADEKIQGVAEGVHGEIQRAHAEVPAVRILSRIDELPEALIDLLGWQFHVDFWDSTLPIERKRELVKTSIKVHKTKGTPGAVETVLEAIGFDSKVIEWFEYAGDPYRFKVEVDMTGVSISTELADKLTALINEYKNTRSWLDALSMTATGRGTVNTGMATMAGETGTVFPWSVSEIETQSLVYSAVSFVPGVEIGTIYPKEIL